VAIADWDSWDEWEPDSGWMTASSGEGSVYGAASEEGSRALYYKAGRVLREIAIDYGLRFERDRRRKIEGLIKKLEFCLRQADEVGMDAIYSELAHEMHKINYAAYLRGLDDDDSAASAVVRR
jgi:hypothetical protein